MATATAEKDVRLMEFISGVGGNVDTENHVIKGVKILGASSKNGRRYSEAAMRSAASLYEGAKVNLNHPKGKASEPRGYEERIGHLKGVTYRESSLYADLHYNPKHPNADQLVYDAQHSPGNGGFSHNVEAKTSRQNGQLVVESITRVVSVDLVADPATTNGIFESIQEPDAMSLTEVTLEQIKTARPDLVSSILTEAKQSAEAVAQANELKTLREELDAFKTKEKLAARKAEVDAKLTEGMKGVDYATADGWIRLHTNAPHHRDAALGVLGVGVDRAAVAEAVKPKKTTKKAADAAEPVAEAKKPRATKAKKTEGDA